MTEDVPSYLLNDIKELAELCLQATTIDERQAVLRKRIDEGMATLNTTKLTTPFATASIRMQATYAKILPAALKKAIGEAAIDYIYEAVDEKGLAEARPEAFTKLKCKLSERRVVVIDMGKRA
jgi:hypothetical protein